MNKIYSAVLAVVFVFSISNVIAGDHGDSPVSSTDSSVVPGHTEFEFTEPDSTVTDDDLMRRLRSIIKKLKHENVDAEGCLYG
jgi:hypothetical protein